MKKIKIDDFAKYKFLSGIKHSPDGKHACFAVHEADIEENKYRSNLWLLDIKKESYYQLTAFDSERSFLWIDNEHIIFSDIRDIKDRERRDNGEEFTQYYKINIHGGEAVKFFRIPRNVNSIKTIDKDTFIFTSDYNSNQRDLNSLSEEEKSEEIKFRKEEKDYEILEEIPFWSNGGGFTNRQRNRLYIYNVANNKVEAITDEYTNVDLFNLSLDRKKIIIIAYNFKDKMPLVNDMYLYNIENKEFSKISREELAHYYANFISEDTIIYTGSDMKKYGVNENEKVYVMNFNSQEIALITPELDVALTNSVGSDCRYGSSDSKQIENGYLYFVATEGENSLLNRIDMYGNIEKLVSEEGSVDGISINNGNMLFIGMSTNKLQEIFKKEKNNIRQLTMFNEWIQLEKSISSPEKVSVETASGVVIDGWLMKPVDFDKNKKYPAILDIHGGPKTVYGTVFFHEMQYWANEGYAVFFCNPRGSDGKGNEFADIRGKYGTIDYEDIMKFTDEVFSKYSFIDVERVGVTGGSYGGFMTNWIIGHTDRFKAAASQRSISNWISKFNTTDIGYFFVDDQIAATPWNNQEKLWEHSPLKYADKVKTPTLFLHSEEDYRCWLVEGIQMFTALKYHGIEARLCMFRGENHELSRSGKPKHRLRRLREITEWFNKHLK
jgi:dipeptidyl aminopeptidase/acylaminoacyl peptidase